jgi:hypothetical protein
MAKKAYQKTKQQIEEEALSQHTGIPIEECHNFLNADSEADQVRFIKAHLRTSDQKDWLDKQDLSIEDVMNGRFNEHQEGYIQKMHEEWNLKLGRKIFGF